MALGGGQSRTMKHDENELELICMCCLVKSKWQVKLASCGLSSQFGHFAVRVDVTELLSTAFSDFDQR